MNRGEIGKDGVLVIRVWHDAGAEAGSGFRARIIFGGEDPAAASEFLVVRDPEKVIEAVRNWLGTVGR